VIPDLRLDEFAQMSLEALVAPEVGIASWRANTWTCGDRVLRAASASASDAGVALDPVRVPAQ